MQFFAFLTSCVQFSSGVVKNICNWLGQQHHQFNTRITIRNVGGHLKTIKPMEEMAAVKLGAVRYFDLN
jgi:hypothetical protein